MDKKIKALSRKATRTLNLKEWKPTFTDRDEDNMPVYDTFSSKSSNLTVQISEDGSFYLHTDEDLEGDMKIASTVAYKLLSDMDQTGVYTTAQGETEEEEEEEDISSVTSDTNEDTIATQ